MIVLFSSIYRCQASGRDGQKLLAAVGLASFLCPVCLSSFRLTFDDEYEEAQTQVSAIFLDHLPSILLELGMQIHTVVIYNQVPSWGPKEHMFLKGLCSLFDDDLVTEDVGFNNMINNHCLLESIAAWPARDKDTRKVDVKMGDRGFVPNDSLTFGPLTPTSIQITIEHPEFNVQRAQQDARSGRTL
eukprot:TRINITY_DN11837_c0_g1_i4.p3 TRINITY_DN11837_c0_g1~~TRINITY_DN11837_c0_g1_i4.p3  ORF type:complete len:187 (+),score=21.72 TRINITY_DN11837_c0_g1_i4:34-594(+)